MMNENIKKTLEESFKEAYDEGFKSGAESVLNVLEEFIKNYKNSLPYLVSKLDDK